jgi:phage shock protein PspC (stress-responsive transcriptional regulator)
MQRKLLGIINVAFNATGRLLIMYFAFAKCLKKNGNTKKKFIHQLFIDFKKAYDSVRRDVLYKILIEFGIPRKLVRLIKMSLTETYSRVR